MQMTLEVLRKDLKSDEHLDEVVLFFSVNVSGCNGISMRSYCFPQMSAVAMLSGGRRFHPRCIYRRSDRDERNSSFPQGSAKEKHLASPSDARADDAQQFRNGIISPVKNPWRIPFTLRCERKMWHPAHSHLSIFPVLNIASTVFPLSLVNLLLFRTPTTTVVSFSPTSS